MKLSHFVYSILLIIFFLHIDDFFVNNFSQLFP